MSPCTTSRTIRTSAPTIWHSARSNKGSGFAAKKTVHQGIVEIKEALDRGLITGDDPTCYTLQWYKSLIEWQKRIDGLKLDGKLL